MADLILHIGTHKTATSTLQNVFSANRALLLRHGLIYPDIGRTTGHHVLTTPWVSLPPVYQLSGGARPLWEELAARHAGAAGTLFLSSEEFSRGDPRSRVDFADLRRYLGDFDRVTVLCTLRDQLSYLQSIYLQVARHNVAPPWPQFFAEALESGFASGLFLDFNALDDHLLRGFDAAEIVYLDYRAACAEPDGILGAMLRRAGCGLDAAALDLAGQGSSNVSPEPLAAWAAGLLATPRPATAPLFALTAGALALEIGDGRRNTIYTRAEEARLIARFAGPNQAFAARIAARQPGFALSPPRPAPEAVHREDIQGSFWLRVARRLHAAAAGADPVAPVAA